MTNFWASLGPNRTCLILLVFLVLHWPSGATRAGSYYWNRGRHRLHSFSLIIVYDFPFSASWRFTVNSAWRHLRSHVYCWLAFRTYLYFYLYNLVNFFLLTYVGLLLNKPLQGSASVLWTLAFKVFFFYQALSNDFSFYFILCYIW